MNAQICSSNVFQHPSITRRNFPDNSETAKNAKVFSPQSFPLYGNFLSVSQEAYIAELDAKSGASLKLTVLNPYGRIWTMVAGGGASVIYR